MRSALAGLAQALLIACWLVGCGDDPPQATVSTGDGGPRPEDGGGGDSGPPSPRPDGGAILPPADDELVLAYGEGAVTFELAGEASLGVLDLHLSVDTTASIDTEIDEIQVELDRTILPALRDVVPSLSVGVSRFQDFPGLPFGNARDSSYRGDRPFELLTPVTSSARDITEAVERLDQPLGIGGDIAESGAEALYQIATGEGFSSGGKQLIAPFEGGPVRGGGSVGGVGFREGALHVVLHITDAPSHTPDDYAPDFPGTRSMAEASAALAAIGARVVSIVSGVCKVRSAECDDRHALTARAELEAVAFETGAFTEPDRRGECPHGIDGQERPVYEEVCPLVFDVSDKGEGLTETFTSAVTTLVNDIRFKRVTAIAANDPLGFVERVRPIAVGEEAPEIADLLPAGAPDGELDTFVDARAAAPLVFEVTLRNERLPPRDEPQVFRVVLQILGDGLIVLERTLRIVVPAGGLPQAPDEDAGR
jgi:hypothetical protein